MNFTPDGHAEELRKVIRSFLEKRSSEVEVRRLMATPTGYDESVWLAAAGELGLHGLAIPERHGGSGAGAVELGVVSKELGRSLFCGPFLATVGLAASPWKEVRRS